MKKKYYWKVVKPITPGVYGSCIIRQGKYSRFYRIGMPTESAMKENGIFVFDTRENARRFRKSIAHIKLIDSYFMIGKIFKCKVHGKEINYPTYYSTIELMNNCKKDYGAFFPPGTKSFPSITLVE